MENEEPKVNMEKGQGDKSKSSNSQEFSTVEEAKNAAKEAVKKTKDEKNSVENILKNADDKLKARMLEDFLNQVNEKLRNDNVKDDNGNIKQVNSYEELTVEEREEFKKFKLPDAEMKEMCKDTSSKIEKVTSGRDKKLADLGQRIDDFKAKLEEEIKIREEQMKDASPEKAEQLENEIEQIRNDKEYLGKAIGNTYINHETAKKNAINGLEIVYSKEIVRSVYGEPGNSIRKFASDEKKEEYNKSDNEVKEKDEKQENEQQTQHGSNNNIKEGNANSQYQENNVQPVNKKTNAVTLGKDISYAEFLGVKSNDKVTYRDSLEVMDIFLGNKPNSMKAMLNDSLRLAVLQSPEGAKIIQDALMNMNNLSKPIYKHPIFAIKNLEMNYKLKKMIEKRLPQFIKQQNEAISDKDKETIANDMGIDEKQLDIKGDVLKQVKNMSPEEINDLKSKVDLLDKNYKDTLENISIEMGKSGISQEEIEKYQAQYDNIRNRRSLLSQSIGEPVSLEQFSKIADSAIKGERNSDYMLNPSSKLDNVNMDEYDFRSSLSEKRDDINKKSNKELQNQIEDVHKSAVEKNIDGPSI